MATVIVDDRAAAMRVGYEATDWSAPLTFDAYESALRDWTVRAIQRDGEVIGAVFTKDGELHVSIRPDWRRRWMTKGILRELFAKPVKTRVAAGHDYMRGVLERLGFTEHSNGMFVKENCYGH